MKFALSLLTFGLAVIASRPVSAAATPLHFKTINQMIANADFHMTCTGKGLGDQLNFGFHYNALLGAAFSVDHAGLSIASPMEALFVREYGANLFTLTVAPGSTQLTLSGGSASGNPPHNDSIQLIVKDSLNGKFPGSLFYKDVATNFTFQRDVVCGSANYTIPRPN